MACGGPYESEICHIEVTFALCTCVVGNNAYRTETV